MEIASSPPASACEEVWEETQKLSRNPAQGDENSDEKQDNETEKVGIPGTGRTTGKQR